MDGYQTFETLTLQRWKRFVVVQHVSPLVDIAELEAYFSRFGEIERIWFKHNPENGCFMKKALILMKSPSAAAAIIDKVYHVFSKNLKPSPETAPVALVTTVKYRGRVKIYTRGRFNLLLNLELSLKQNSERGRTDAGLYLTRELVRAFQGLNFTAIKLETDDKYKYTGFATVSFHNKSDEEIVFKRTHEQLKVSCRWVDSEVVPDGVEGNVDGAMPLLETARDAYVTSVKDRGSVKMYRHGRYKLSLMLDLPWSQDCEKDRTDMGLHLTRELLTAYQGLIFTISFHTDGDNNYTGSAILSFHNKSDEEIVLKRTHEQLKVSCQWVDSEYGVEGDGEGYDNLVEEGSDDNSDEEGAEGDGEGDEEGPEYNSDGGSIIW